MTTRKTKLLYCSILISNLIILRGSNNKLVYATSSADSNKSSFISGISLSSPWSTIRRVFATSTNSSTASTSSSSTSTAATAAATTSRDFLDSELDFLKYIVTDEEDHPVAAAENTTLSSSILNQTQHQQQLEQQSTMVSIEDSSATSDGQQHQYNEEEEIISPLRRERIRRNAAFGLQEEESEEFGSSSAIEEDSRGVEQEEQNMEEEEEDDEEIPHSDYYYEYDDDQEEEEEEDDDWNRLPRKVPYREEDEDLQNQIGRTMTTHPTTTVFSEEDNTPSVTADAQAVTLVTIRNDANSNNSTFENDQKQNNKVFMLQSNTVSLRHLRKTASRMTGMTGFFSGKQKQNMMKVTTMYNNKDSNNSTIEEHLGDDELGMIRRRIAAIKKARDAVVNMEEKMRRRTSSTSTAGTMDGTAAMGPLRWLAAKRSALLLNSQSSDSRKQQEANNDAQKNNNNNIQQSSLLSEQEGIDLFREYPAVLDAVASAEAEAQKVRKIAAQAEEERRKVRVSEINRQIGMARDYLFELQCEKDDILRRPNPFFNFTATAGTTKKKREFNFPSQGLVDEYIEQLVSSRRLIILNHTFLWKEAVTTDFDEDDDNAGVDDDIFTTTPFSDARKHMLYRTGTTIYNSRRRSQGIANRNVSPTSLQSRNGANNSNGGGGSWLLRQSIGKGESLGEKIGQVIETSTYKAVCKNVMSILARSISSLHGLSILNHSYVRLYMESAPDLPPVGDLLFNGGDTYAEETFKRAIRRTAAGSAGNDSSSIRKRKKSSRRNNKSFMDDNSSFLQRDAVVETLLSHCQISAPLLKLFPLPWQRALLANIVTLVVAVVSDFASGIRVQILGHTLSLSLEPITESDLLDQIESNFPNFDSSRRAAEFEEAVTATASDLSEQLLFLDKWHERALGSGMLRAQIANLIARIVLTVVDDILSGTEINLWTKQASGPRVIADLEYRVM